MKIMKYHFLIYFFQGAKFTTVYRRIERLLSRHLP